MDKQTQAVADALREVEPWMTAEDQVKYAKAAIKASGAEHLVELVSVLENLIATPDNIETQWKQGRKAGLAEALAYIKEGLPPELRGES